MNKTIGIIADVTTGVLAGKDPAFTLVLGIPTLQTGVFGGIVMGIVAASLYKRFYNFVS